ncbi:E3 ubiquitin-protein ligase RBBP6-like [Patagioenas fasciata]|uniref:E3 ubiquitin-protein ligase RBBP6-like n=1 Tax=Patagioenas fasciata TaxID=372321 RepID=UPI003A99AAD3
MASEQTGALGCHTQLTQNLCHNARHRGADAVTLQLTGTTARVGCSSATSHQLKESTLQIAATAVGTMSSEHTDNNAPVSKKPSAIVGRIADEAAKAPSKTHVLSPKEPIDDSPAPLSLAQLIKDKAFEPVPRIKKSTGIPRSFLMEVEDPSTRGALLTNTGKYAIPIINAEAYARRKKEKPPFLPAEPPSSSSSNHDPVPEELLCLICKNITTDAVVIPCCGNSYCDECIRTALLESEEHKCPTCHRTDVSPDALFANKFLRQAVNNFRNGTVYTERVRKQLWQQPPPLVTPPAALVTNAELSSSSSLPISSLSAEKDCQVPAPRQAALPHLLGPTTGPSMRARAMCSAGHKTAWELSESRCSALSYPGSSYTHCKSRSGSSCTRSDSRSRSRSRSRSHSPLPPSPRRGKGKSLTYRSRSRWRGDHRSGSRSPVFRGQSRTQRTTPQGQGEREYFNRHTAVPLYGMKAAYGRSVEFQDPFEKERYREWERNYGEWSGKPDKGCAAGAQPALPPNRGNFFPERFDPPETRREILPYAWGRREDYPGGHSHENHCIAGDDPEKPSGREHHGTENPTNSKEVKNPLGDDRANKQRFQGKRRREDENEGFPNAELFEDAKKPKRAR